MSKVFIEESTLVGMADIIRESKGTTELYDPANFRNEFKEIIENGSGGGSSVEGGFTVNFHSEDGELIESHSAELGRDIYAPASFNEVNYWSDANGVPYTFPLTTNEVDTVLDLYATEAQTCAQVLYDYFGYEPTTYPDVAIRTDASYIDVMFGTDIANRVGIRKCAQYNNADTTFSTDILALTQCIVEAGLTFSHSNNCGLTGTYNFTNFENELSSGRLDQVFFDTNDRLHPYALQEKTVVSSGDVVPDEGYYGLSKVTVDVESSPSINSGFTVNFYNSDNELIEIHGALFGYRIDEPIDYSAEMWVDANGTTSNFPLTINETDGITSLDLYAVGGESATYLINSTGTQYGDTFFSADGVPQSGDATIGSNESQKGQSDILAKSYDTVYSLSGTTRTNHSIVFNDLINCSGYKYLAVRYLYEHLDQTYNNARLFLLDNKAVDGSYGSPTSALKTLSLVDSSLITSYYTSTYGDDYLNNEDAYRWATIALDDITSFYLAFHSCASNLYVADVKLIR